ncbi:GRIN2B [Lepeophtheirus salmonis]|uniref:GRIN2B n=1 Tax=Lepeophtheirus salmonis TaxID=72036 RepID=A0A7R8CBF9_LEPSM|nr:GRIN2B [Lepeophtheirus salmonis]CAF2752782.1 GRIN2B [Lepeophtheirus salmonis]
MILSTLFFSSPTISCYLQRDNNKLIFQNQFPDIAAVEHTLEVGKIPEILIFVSLNLTILHQRHRRQQLPIRIFQGIATQFHKSHMMEKKSDLKVGIILPKQIFQQRRYQSVIARSIENIAIERSSSAQNLSYFQLVSSRYNFDWKSGLFLLEDQFDAINFAHMEVSPPPADITTILSSTQYFLQMAGFLGIPVIAWNADNSGLETRSNTRIGSKFTGYLQLAPSVAHQVSALLSILDRYNWNQFGIVTSDIAGHDDFVQAIRDALHQPSRSQYVIQNVFKVSESNNWSVEELTSSEVRIILLYCTQSEASIIFKKANETGLTSHNYLWLVTQSVIGDPTVRISHRKKFTSRNIRNSF